ncbi:hypothetical protein LZQ00_05740 [Sphingobacterium sp. SRCM116780]|uniref:hypothetical protein n=1 Tax=Sphingobacterium sp. SRCM116780 TaxID=2907623 RepID=UPI001F225967|nr:hypothetical protein [Sphingobacterium sp. SRCM116780]UIR57316.1 hypothetical protein LZQ00_05740 [Sphingobacterium sp. SRCM116780]
MGDKFEKWNINEQLPNDLSFYKIEGVYSQLVILLKNLIDNTQILEIKFEYFVSYKVILDLALMKMVNENPTFRGFARTNSSSYLSSIIEGSYEIINKNELEHFLIYNIDNAIEVISDKAGTFRWFDKEEVRNCQGL